MAIKEQKVVNQKLINQKDALVHATAKSLDDIARDIIDLMSKVQTDRRLFESFNGKTAKLQQIEDVYVKFSELEVLGGIISDKIAELETDVDDTLKMIKDELTADELKAEGVSSGSKSKSTDGLKSKVSISDALEMTKRNKKSINLA